VARHTRLQPHNPLRTVLMRVGFTLLAIALGYLIYEFGRIQANYNILDAAQERQGYEDHIETLNAEIASLNQQIALLQTHREIDREAYKEVEASLVTLQAKIQEQTEAIGFYRGIVSPADGAAGLRIQDLKLTRGETERTFNVRLVLVQSLKHDRKVSGDIVLTIKGEEQGAVTSYDYAQLLPDESEAGWPFSFRYFQDFDRQVVLPDGFTPEEITIQVRSKTSSVDSIEETYSWTSSLG